jgi:DNA-binding NtrC family response regulator
MKPRVLVLDDQVRYGRALERALGADFDVRVAEDVDSAKAQLGPTVALVLSDIRLNEADSGDRQGLAFIRFARSQFTSLPIVAMSALDDPDTSDQAIAAGATQFMRKPIVVSELRRLLAILAP